MASTKKVAGLEILRRDLVANFRNLSKQDRILLIGTFKELEKQLVGEPEEDIIIDVKKAMGK